jgi:hypothetical protein
METRTVLKYIGAGVAMLAMLVLAPFFLASGLVAPLWAVIALCLIWVAIFVLGCLWFKRKPLWVLPLPVLALLIWLGGVQLGSSVLGWSA